MNLTLILNELLIHPLLYQPASICNRRGAVISPLNIELFKVCEKLPFAYYFTVCKFSSFCLMKKDQ